MKSGFKPHPIAGIFPMFQEGDLANLADDIRAHGQRNVGYVFEGKLLDGRNRQAACKIAGVEFKTKEFKGTFSEAIAFVWSENNKRRHLNAGQIAVAVAKRDALFDDACAKVDKLKASQPKGGRPKKGEKPDQQIGPVSKAERSTSAIRAKAEGTNKRYLEAAEKLLATDPERLVAVEKGEKTLSQVIREVSQGQAKAKQAKLPSGKYRVIYADPPWNYGNSGSGLEQYGPAERHYPAMTIAELCALDVKGIADANAVLFLWVTSPLLDAFWPVIKAWGFDYKTSFVWDKVKHNFGHYNSVRHEFLLVCTRGSCTPDAKKLFDSVVSVERSGKHSQKPAEFRTMIETLYTHGKRIELFARTASKGWDAYGNEV